MDPSRVNVFEHVLKEFKYTASSGHTSVWAMERAVRSGPNCSNGQRRPLQSDSLTL